MQRSHGRRQRPRPRRPHRPENRTPTGADRLDSLKGDGPRYAAWRSAPPAPPARATRGDPSSCLPMNPCSALFDSKNVTPAAATNPSRSISMGREFESPKSPPARTCARWPCTRASRSTSSERAREGPAPPPPGGRVATSITSGVTVCA